MEELSTKEETFTTNNSNEIKIPVFDIHSKTIGNGNGRSRIATYAYTFRCHPNKFLVFTSQLARYSDDLTSNLSFIPLRLIQMITTTTYRRQFTFQNNHIASKTIIPIHEMTKEYIHETAEKEIMQTSEISRVEEIYLTQSQGKWLVVIDKACKNQVKL